MVQQALVVSQLIDSMSFIKIYTTLHCFKLSALHYFSSINVSALDSYCFVGRDFQFSFDFEIYADVRGILVSVLYSRFD